jgi:site-specific DNA-cytosine methylase
MKRGDIPTAPILGDIRSVVSESISGPVELIVSTFPCQGLSCLGKRRGLQDARSGLFFEVLRLFDELQPNAIFFENVPNVVSYAMDTMVDELFFERGLELRWSCMRASDCGAPHLRNRWFCLARRPGFVHTFSELRYSRYDWSGTEPNRLLPLCPNARSARRAMFAELDRVSRGLLLNSYSRRARFVPARLLRSAPFSRRQSILHTRSLPRVSRSVAFLCWCLNPYIRPNSRYSLYRSTRSHSVFRIVRIVRIVESS